MDESDLRMDQRVRKSTRETLRESFVTGLAVVVPVLVTVIVLAIAFQYVYNYLTILARGIIDAGNLVNIPVYGDIPVGLVVIQLATPVILLAVIMVVGVFTNTTEWGERAVNYFDYFISQIPAVGGVYESFRQMSNVMLESDTQSFREVKLVEFPHEGAYTLGFVTTETPDALAEPAGHPEMLTLFLPLAPNPVMGGHLVHMPADRVMDVDMTVEEGIRAIVTSGVAVAGGSQNAAGSRNGDGGLSASAMRDLAGAEYADQQFAPERDSPTVRRSEPVDTDRAGTYDESVHPRRATTPDDIARRERPEDEADAGSTPDGTHATDAARANVTPAEEAGRYSDEADVTDRPPATAADRASEARESTDETPAAAAGREPADDDATDVEGAPPDDAEPDPSDEQPPEDADEGA